MKNDFTVKFQKAPRAIPASVSANDVIVPDFTNNDLQLGAHSFKLYGDVTDVNFSNAGRMLDYIRFSNETVFPTSDKMPDGFNPQQVLENGKNPGLNINKLHSAGITGAGITVAIIDQELNTEHAEIKDNIIHYESIGYPETTHASQHGTAVSSILAGKTLGVAPDAKIVYFATIINKPSYEGEQPQNVCGQNYYFTSRIKALQTILNMNKILPPDQKISAVSISSGLLSFNDTCSKLIRQLIESGVMVLTTDSDRFYKDAGFMTLDRTMNSDADNIESYHSGFWKNYKYINNNILVPAGGRTIAGFHSDNEYIYCGACGGMSWATPYLVGVYALAKQVEPNLTPNHFFELAHKVGAHSDKVGNNVIIQPQKIIQQLQQERLLQKQYTESHAK